MNYSNSNTQVPITEPLDLVMYISGATLPINRLVFLLAMFCECGGSPDIYAYA